jgi:hypothetical protein
VGITDNLGAILLPMWHAAGSADFSLTLKDSSSKVLESWTADAPDISSSTPVVQLTSVLHPLLHQGQTYSLTAIGLDTTLDAWDAGDSFNLSKAGFRVEGVSTTAAPEPSSLTLLGLGALGLLGYRWRRRKQPTA